MFFANMNPPSPEKLVSPEVMFPVPKIPIVVLAKVALILASFSIDIETEVACCSLNGAPCLIIRIKQDLSKGDSIESFWFTLATEVKSSKVPFSRAFWLAAPRAEELHVEFFADTSA